MNKFLALCSVVLFVGCSTVADLRAKAPYQTLESNKQPREIVNCVMYKASAEDFGPIPPWFVQSEYPPGTFHICLQMPAFLGAPPSRVIGEVDFKPIPNGGTLIEFRTKRYYWKDVIWEIVKKCAGH